MFDELNTIFAGDGGWELQVGEVRLDDPKFFVSLLIELIIGDFDGSIVQVVSSLQNKL
jgi:hypothetical protein